MNNGGFGELSCFVDDKLEIIKLDKIISERDVGISERDEVKFDLNYEYEVLNAKLENKIQDE